jgi:hypothetical protein
MKFPKSPEMKFLSMVVILSGLASPIYSASLQIANTSYSVKFGNYSSLSEVTSSNLPVSYSNPSAGSGYGTALGYFVAGFTPTTSNVSDWLTNFRGYRGYWDNGPNIQAAITLKFIAGPSNDPDNGAFDNLPVGASNSSAINIADNVTQFLEGQSVKLIIWGGTWNTTSPSLSAGVGIFSSSAWVVPSVYDIESPDALVNSLFINTSTTADIGLIDNTTTGLTARTILLIPEPTTGSLMLGGLALIAIFRNRKKGAGHE